MRKICVIAFLAGALWGTLHAQTPGRTEALTAWPFFKSIQHSNGGSGLYDVVLDRETLDKARLDQGDLRLYDNTGREIPYVLRTRRAVDTEAELAGREFNRAEGGEETLLSTDLGEQPVEHNEVEIETDGSDFRRLADVEGSPDGARWFTLTSRVILFRFSAGGRDVEQASVAYPVSRFRYLRVRVHRDPQVDRESPSIRSLRIRRSVHLKGELLLIPGSVEGRESDRVDGRPASIRRVDFGGRVPLEGLLIGTVDTGFSRPFVLEDVDDPTAPVVLASGELVRHENDTRSLRIDIAEHAARRLKLTVTDDRNAPLSITTITALSAARQVIFEAASAGNGPIRLYYGNPQALAPHYDLGTRLPAEFTPAPERLTLSAEWRNPIYRPEPKPLSERHPWLIYVVLVAACVALAWILLNLARASAREATSATL